MKNILTYTFGILLLATLFFVGSPVRASDEVTITDIVKSDVEATINGVLNHATLVAITADHSGLILMYSTDHNNLSITSNVFYPPDDIDAAGKWNRHLTGLTPNTTYYFDVHNSETGVSYLPSIQSFTTLGSTGGEEQVIFDSLNSGITETDAIISGVVFGAQGQALPTIKLKWQAEGSASVTSSDPIVPNANTGMFSYSVTGLSASTTYTLTAVNNADTTVVLGTAQIATAAPGGDGGVVIGNDTGTGGTQSGDCVEGHGEYCLLAPLPIFGNKVDSSLSFGNYVNGFLKVLIGLAAVLAVIMIVVGGIQHMSSSDSVSLKTEGAKRATNAVWGLLLVLGSFAILNTINPNLVNLKIGIQTAGFALDEPPEEVALPGGGIDSCSGVTLNGQRILKFSDWGANATIAAVDADVRSHITGVTVNAPNCAKVGDTGCTSMYFSAAAKQDVISKLNLINTACTQANGSACDMVITGGSECWLHKTHNHEAAVFDLRATTSLNVFVTGSNTFPADGRWHNKPGYGNFLAESSGQTQNTTAEHWHVKLY